MFELSIIRKYLIPDRKNLSVTLISLMSIGVIALVVWLVLVFLSVTTGIEQLWLNKLTALNAPIQIKPTQHYYQSFYYRVDSISRSSHYQSKTISEKANSLLSNPHSIEEDGEIPSYWPAPDLKDKKLKDPVKELFNCLQSLQHVDATLNFQDYEMSGALLRLNLKRPTSFQEEQASSFLTQVSYLSSFPENNPHLSTLILPPTKKDIDNLTYQLKYSSDKGSNKTVVSNDHAPFKNRVRALLDHLNFNRVETDQLNWQIPYHLLPCHQPFTAYATFTNSNIHHLTLLTDKQDAVHLADSQYGILVRDGSNIRFHDQPIPEKTPCLISGSILLDAKIDQQSLHVAEQLSDIRFDVRGNLQGFKLTGSIPWKNLTIDAVSTPIDLQKDSKSTPPWVYKLGHRYLLPGFEGAEQPIVLAKNFQDSGVCIGDMGYLSYQASTPSGSREQRICVAVAGFYDPGLVSIGNKYILVPQAICRTINGGNQIQHFDPTEVNGIMVWLADLKKAPEFKLLIENRLKEAGIDKYWSVKSFYEYDFAQDLLHQFQSDRYLFALIGVIILMVACCNIISLLVILVNNKKKEIGVLQAMGASPFSIAIIFGGCGAIMGLISSLIGIAAAMVTLKNLDLLVGFLSYLQGQQTFNAAFYGTSLPNHLSQEAILFVLIVTPIISLLAGLIPVMKACRLRPSEILRSE
jgi:lipoprotein-releasing system permease protein